MIEAPSIAEHHITGNAKLFANRYDMVDSLCNRSWDTVVEVGVAFGDFSKFLIRKMQPKRFVAIDTFVLTEDGECMGKPVSGKLNGMDHEAFFRQQVPEAEVIKALSFVGLAQVEGDLDFVYLDAGHTYEEIAQDLDVATRKLAPRGCIVVNDYVIGDTVHMPGAGEYGVVRAVNEMVTNGGWKITGFALEKNMYCDIALRRG